MKLENISIIGMGALGMLYGDMLDRSLGREHVSFIVDEARLARYAKRAFTVNVRPCDFRMTTAPDAPADLVIFATKFTGLARAIEDAAPFIGPDTALISLLNGISSEQFLEARFGRDRVVYCVAQGMDAVKLGSALTYSQPGVLCLGIPNDGRPADALDAVCALFERAGVPHQRDEDILHRLWSKFMLNVGVNQVVMACEGTYGTIQKPGPERERMIAAMREVIDVARCEGVTITEADLKYYVDLMSTLSPDGMPSMRQDGLARRPSEVELFSGTVRRLARRHGLACPVNDALYAEITQREATYLNNPEA